MQAMETERSDSARHENRFRVVHFVDQWPQGLTKLVLGENLTFDAAKKLAEHEVEGTEGEGMTIEDMKNPGWRYDVKETGTGDHRTGG